MDPNATLRRINDLLGIPVGALASGDAELFGACNDIYEWLHHRGGFEPDYRAYPFLFETIRAERTRAIRMEGVND